MGSKRKHILPPFPLDSGRPCHLSLPLGSLKSLATKAQASPILADVQTRTPLNYWKGSLKELPCHTQSPSLRAPSPKENEIKTASDQNQITEKLSVTSLNIFKSSLLENNLPKKITLPSISTALFKRPRAEVPAVATAQSRPLKFSSAGDGVGQR